MTATGVPGSLSLAMDTAREDDRNDLDVAFDRCARGLYRFIVVRVGGDAHLADDLMQQLWLRADRRGRGVPAGELAFWLRAVARNLVHDHWRTAARRPANVPMSDPALAAELSERLVTEELPEAVLDRCEVRDQLLLAVTELREEEQALIIEHYFRGASQAELACKLGISDRAVEGRLYRARQSLRASLKDLGT